MHCFRRNYADIENLFPPNTVWYEEGIADHAALHVVDNSFKFLHEDYGRVETSLFAGYEYPEVFWIAVVKPFCFTDEFFGNPDKDRKFSKAKVDYALKNHQNFPAEFKCGPNSPMRSGECKAWISD